MANVKAVVYEEFKRADGTYNVKIKVYHKQQKRFIDTTHFVTARQMNGDLQIKDKFVLNSIDAILVDYRRSIGDLGRKLDWMSCDDLKTFLENKDVEIDFIKFCDYHIAGLKKVKRDGTARNQNRVRNGLVDYFQRSQVPITEINSTMLFKMEKWLKTDRTILRTNQMQKEVKTTEEGVNAGGLYTFMRDLRTLFNEAKKLYNNEDIGIIRIHHYPFKVYKIGAPPKTRKRNITPEQIMTIRDCEVPAGSRAELAKDLFMLSFYLCGINAIDIYKIDRYEQSWERLDYNRSKTQEMRDDDAFISIKIVPEARAILVKYMGTLRRRYTNCGGLNTALRKGMEELRKITIIPDITFYWARHSFATIARNKCRMSKDDIAEALNHVDGEHQVTDIYIEKDWSIVDDVQSAVMQLIRGLDKPPENYTAVESIPVKPVMENPDEQRRTMRLVSA